MIPLKTHVIVMGIERYDIGDAWNLNGPAVDAAEFIRWLRGRGVPPENIAFFASPLAENREELKSLDVQYQSPDSKTIMDAMSREFEKRRGELLLVMWGGHGVISEGSRRLFFSDVSENRLLSLDVDGYLNYLRSTFMPGFAKQAVFLDACANYFELQQSPVALAPVPIVAGVPRNGVSQFVLFGAGEGERAKNQGALRKGLFSSILLDELRKAPLPDWPPDLLLIESRIDKRFAELRANGKASQTPVRFYYRDWNGREEIRYASMQPDLGPAEKELSQALMACQVMQTPRSRQLLLGELRARKVKAADQIIYVEDKTIHVELIVSALTRSGDRGTLIVIVLEQTEGEAANRLARVQLEVEQQLFDYATVARLRLLLDPLELNQTEVQRIFLECARPLAMGPGSEQARVYDLLMKLAGFPPQTSSFPVPVLLFMEKIAGMVSQAGVVFQKVGDDLREIVDSITSQRNLTEYIRDYRTGRAWQSTSGNSTLIVEMKPKASGFALRATLLDPDGHWTPLATEDTPISEMAAREKFRELVSEADRQSSHLTIEMAVSREMLCWPLDRWEVDLGGYPVLVGAHYPMVLRWLDRMRDKSYQNRWCTKWQSVKSYSGEPLWLCRSDEFQPGQLLAILGSTSKAGTFISFAFPPSRTREAQGDPLSVALSGGTPVAIWCRECDADPDLAKKELKLLLTQKNLEELPEMVRTVRNRAAQILDAKHPGCRIALLFDNHDHRPPHLPG
jgi:hypothetical protein